ncbi:MAG: CoxG family protein [Chloroflexota bacterium]
MPEGCKVFRVPVPIERAWEFLTSMEQVGACVPGCEEVRVLGDRESVWKVRAELGPLSRLLEMRATTVTLEPPTHGTFLARGRDLETRGDIRLRALSDGETEVTYAVRAEALGFGKGLVNSAISLAIQSQADDFARNVQATLR